MKVLEAIRINNEAFLRKQKASAAFSDPVAVLACIDPRLTPFLNSALGFAPGDVVWVRNAGNIILDPVGDPLRSLAVAVFLKGATEILVLGHTDCLLGQLEINTLLEAFSKQGVHRQSLGSLDLRKWIGAFHDSKRNIRQSVDQIRNCPFIPRSIPVHGLLMDTTSGAIEILQEGYDLKKGLPIGSPVTSPMVDRPVTPIVSQCEESGPSKPVIPAESKPLRVKEGTIQKKEAPLEKTPLTGPPPLPWTTPGLERLSEKGLLDAIYTLRDFYFAIRQDAKTTAEWNELKKQLSASKDPLAALHLLEQKAVLLAKEHPRIIEACRILHSHAAQSPTKSHLEMLLRRILK